MPQFREPTVFDVFEKDGRYLGRVAAPAAFSSLASRDGRIRTGDPLNPIIINPGIPSHAMRRKCYKLSYLVLPAT